jgi:hypothetical protein
MRVLLLAGLGPYIKNDDYVEGTVLDANKSAEANESYHQIAGHPITADTLWFRSFEGSKQYPVLRPP